jgi:hypothetical protein
VLLVAAAHALTLCDDERADCQRQQQERDLQGGTAWVSALCCSHGPHLQLSGWVQPLLRLPRVNCACLTYNHINSLSECAGLLLTRRAMLLKWSDELIECR